MFRVRSCLRKRGQHCKTSRRRVESITTSVINMYYTTLSAYGRNSWYYTSPPSLIAGDVSYITAISHQIRGDFGSRSALVCLYASLPIITHCATALDDTSAALQSWKCLRAFGQQMFAHVGTSFRPMFLEEIDQTCRKPDDFLRMTLLFA